MTAVVLSHYQAAPLLCAWRAGEVSALTSPDLARSTVEVALGPAGVRFPTGETLPWAAVERIARNESKCFVVAAGEAREILVFSEQTGWVRSLYPTPSAPTMLVSGIPMHRIKGTDPWRDTLTKTAALAPLTGRVLDTATGLGYTAIAAAETAGEVLTIELDPAALDVARLNPWSRPLFEHPRIRRVVSDAVEEVRGLPDGSFDRIVHDPPRIGLAGELYGAAFYRELHRLLRRGGRLFHYVGDPASRSGGRTTTGVVRRLREAGFARVVAAPEAFGVVALR